MLNVSIGQCTSAGVKPENQDAIGYLIPKGQVLSSKGISLAMADGISTSDVGKIAAEAAIDSFLNDYYCTSESWTIRTSGERVILALNSWLSAQSRKTRRHYDRNYGYVCTFSALVFRDDRAHSFHIGDARTYRVIDNGLEQLTKDHRLIISSEQSYLSKALGVEETAEIDYSNYPLQPGDLFIMMTDGVYEFMDSAALLAQLKDPKIDLNWVAQRAVDAALAQGSDDNLSIQIARVENIDRNSMFSLRHKVEALPLPPEPEARQILDGYLIQRQIHQSSRSNVYLATDLESGQLVAIKTPSKSMASDPQYLERFLLEEWIARRINSANVVKVGTPDRERNFLYTVSEYVEGQTLQQWKNDNPNPDLNEVRGILEQIAAGLRAFHRMEMLHQDLKPDNIIIDRNGTVKIIDFGSTIVFGLQEAATQSDQPHLLGSALYSAPEYFLGQYGTFASDQYALGVLAYYMLSGRYPYGTNVPKADTVNAQRRLVYQTVLDNDRTIPAWVDDAIKRAVEVKPHKRYSEISEFIHDLKTPNPRFLEKAKPPLLERDPAMFWKGLSAILAVTLIGVLVH